MKNPLGIAAPFKKNISFPDRGSSPAFGCGDSEPRLPFKMKTFPSGPQLPQQITFHGLCHKKGYE